MAAAADGGAHTSPAVVPGEAVHLAGLLERLDHLGLGELAAGHKLKEVKRGAVERLVAEAGWCGNERCDLGSQSGVAIGAGIAGRADHRHGALGDGALGPGAGGVCQPLRSGGELVPGITAEGVAVPR